MAIMRIRYPFAGVFVALLLLSAYLGLLPHSTPPSPPKEGESPIPSPIPVNDKVLHLVAFFLLSLVFYWVIDTTRRRTVHITLVVCTLILGIGSEIVQALIPNGRTFDPYDILANIIGSLAAIGLCTWYHKRMLERRRKARFGNLMENGDDDVELGLANGTSGQESGVTNVRSLEEEVDNWDENAEDNWEATEDAGNVDTFGSSDELNRKSSPEGTGKITNGDKD